MDKIFFSRQAGGFFNTAIHKAGNIPADAVEINASYYQELMLGQASGLVIKANKNGYPELAPAPLKKEN